jgi:plastocyanin
MRTLLAFAAVASLALPGASLAATPTLTGTVGPGFTIAVTKGKAPVTRLPAGTYRIVVRDRSSDHDFRLVGPGVSRATAVETTGTSTWTVRLRRGTYRYFCEPHQLVMHGSFRVG